MIYVSEISKSGLCDKLVDLVLLETYGHFKKSKLDIPISIFEQADYSKNFQKTRYEDILTHNIEKHIKFNDLLSFSSSQNQNYVSTFNTYLGGCYPIINFYYCFLTDVCSMDEYINYLSNIKYTFNLDESEKLVQTSIPCIGLHLRRTDKISDNPDYGQIATSEIDECDENTKQACLDCIKRGFKVFFICSDDPLICKIYKEFLETNECTVLSTIEEKTFKKTYIDMYNLSQCFAIIMSCKHSNFSVIPSLIGNKKIITVFSEDKMKDSMIRKVEWDSIINVINYKNISIKKIAILGHQGVADFFNQNGLFNYIASSYLNSQTTILIENESNIKLVQALFPLYKVEVAETVTTYNGKESCLICHTTCCDSKCLRDNTKFPKFLNNDYYLQQGVEIIKCNCFKNSTSWEDTRKNIPFNIAFYKYHNIDPHILISRFILPTVTQKELRNFSLNDNQYVVIHDDINRNLPLNLNIVHSRNQNCSIFQLNGASSIMIDCIDIILHSKETHVIDSSYSVMIWCIQHKYNLFKHNCILHNSSRPGRDITIYTHNLPKNWLIV